MIDSQQLQFKKIGALVQQLWKKSLHTTFCILYSIIYYYYYLNTIFLKSVYEKHEKNLLFQVHF